MAMESAEPAAKKQAKPRQSIRYMDSFLFPGPHYCRDEAATPPTWRKATDQQIMLSSWATICKSWIIVTKFGDKLTARYETR